MRIMTYNIEWFDNFFNANNSLKQDEDALTKFHAVASVIRRIDPDIIAVIEAPNTTTTTGERSTVQALETFARRYELRQSKALAKNQFFRPMTIDFIARSARLLSMDKCPSST